MTGALAGALAGGETGRWQVFTVRGGRITATTGFAERDEAAAWAGLAPAAPVPPDAIKWAVPRHRLADDRIELRLPEPADADVLHASRGTAAWRETGHRCPVVRAWLTAGH